MDGQIVGIRFIGATALVLGGIIGFSLWSLKPQKTKQSRAQRRPQPLPPGRATGLSGEVVQAISIWSRYAPVIAIAMYTFVVSLNMFSPQDSDGLQFLSLSGVATQAELLIMILCVPMLFTRSGNLIGTCSLIFICAKTIGLPDLASKMPVGLIILISSNTVIAILADRSPWHKVAAQYFFQHQHHDSCKTTSKRVNRSSRGQTKRVLEVSKKHVAIRTPRQRSVRGGRAGICQPNLTAQAVQVNTPFNPSSRYPRDPQRGLLALLIACGGIVLAIGAILDIKDLAQWLSLIFQTHISLAPTFLGLGLVLTMWTAIAADQQNYPLMLVAGFPSALVCSFFFPSSSTLILVLALVTISSLVLAATNQRPVRRSRQSLHT